MTYLREWGVALCVGALLSGASVSQAAFLDEVTISEWAGTGDNEAYVAIDFKDGAEYAFGVRFDGTMTGLELHEILDAETGVQVTFQDYGWGVFIDGFAYDGHCDSGFAGGEDWWHYWVSDDGETWTSPTYGISDRTVIDGSWDGWRYGYTYTPIPEPATMTILGLGGVLMVFRRK